jgi:hypothetical protein
MKQTGLVLERVQFALGWDEEMDEEPCLDVIGVVDIFSRAGFASRTTG